jgi:NAD/NADP transhydrogenase alpha subunit
MSELVAILTIFLLAVFVGFEVITRVPPVLHTPLFAADNCLMLFADGKEAVQNLSVALKRRS